VHCGIDPEHFAPPEGGRPEDGPLRILTVGRLDSMKGVAILVEAVGELRRRGVAVALTVVGDGPQREHLQRLAERESAGREITWAGPVGQDTIRDHYHAADVFCLPSFAEGIPVVLMEAMSTGLPVVANAITGIPELVEDEVSGLLIRPGRSDLLVDALQRLAADPDLRRRMGRAGRDRVRSEFETGAVGRRLAELLHDELGPASAQPRATPVAART
jgi:glycosyltransferase involved in cell wall biosynthesis